MPTVSVQAEKPKGRNVVLEAFEPSLGPNEELKITFRATQFKMPAPWRFLFVMGLAEQLLYRYWYVGVTPGRVVLCPQKRLAPDASRVVAIPLSDVTVARTWPSGAELLLANHPGELPLKLKLPGIVSFDTMQTLLAKN
jgi:hypothetical protein